MGAYNWLVILMCLGFFGLLYACTYDVVSSFHDTAYTGSDDAVKATGILWACWKYAPIGCIIAVIIYGWINSQKQGGGF